MKIYLVGGAVRDMLMGIEPHERDYVVVGSTEEDMRTLGYHKVGKDFPVFLHPQTHEEYALARTEEKTGSGYHGFTCSFNKDTTVEEDLKRRDLTMNAIALDGEGNYIDPYHGREDIRNKCIRHVSDAFEQDPLRVLRIARFQARFPDFHIHPDTLIKLKSMVQSDDFPTLRKERVYIELKKALLTPQPWLFFETLEKIGGLFLVMHKADTTCIHSNLSKLIALTPEHQFIGLLFYQKDDALRALEKLPLTRSEIFYIKKYKHVENLPTYPTVNDWYALLKNTDALRKRDAMRLLCTVHDTLTHTNKLLTLEAVYKAMDAIQFPDALKGQDAKIIQDYYNTALKTVLEAENALI